jgi:pimeloyl-[acyl-carrier protein] synthase
MYLDTNSLDLWKPGSADDPYAIYERLCGLDPIYYDPSQRCWFLNRHADILSVLRDDRFCQIATLNRTSDLGLQPPALVLPNQLRQLLQQSEDVKTRWLAVRNPPDHTRLRSALTPPFSSAKLEEWRPRIHALTNHLIDRVQAAGAMDIIADFGSPLPLMMISEMLGIPPEDRTRLKDWSSDAEKAFDLYVTPASYTRGAFAVAALATYFSRLIAERQKQPKDDLISTLLGVHAKGTLSKDELVANALLLFIAGNETIVYWIANAMLALLRHPDQLQMLKEDPALIPTAMEEILRFDSPVLFTWRAAATPAEIRGHAIHQGDRMVLLLGAANHDPERFIEPERLDITRTPNPHLAFANGVHHCLGAPLARMQAQIAVSTLLRRLPTLTLPNQPLEWEPSLRLRRLKSLPVRF